jgi:hypothetical protein
MFWKTILFSLASVKLSSNNQYNLFLNDKKIRGISLRGFSIPLMAGLFNAADLRTINWKPSLETRITEA